MCYTSKAAPDKIYALLLHTGQFKNSFASMTFQYDWCVWNRASTLLTVQIWGGVESGASGDVDVIWGRRGSMGGT